MLVGHRTVIGQAVDLVLVDVRTDLGDDDLDLVGLGLLGEDRAQSLSVGIGKSARGDVAAVVGVAPQIGVTNPGHPQVLKLVVLAGRRESNAVIDLGHLVQSTGGVLGNEGDASVIAQNHDRATSGDSLAGEVRPVLHELLGRDVERHSHRAPPGLPWRSATICATTAARVSSSRKRRPSTSTTASEGQILRLRSGPPVAESSSAAS